MGKARLVDVGAGLGVALIGAAALVGVTLLTAQQNQQMYETTQKQAAYRAFVNSMNSFEDVYEQGRAAVQSNSQHNQSVRHSLEVALVKIRGAKSVIDLIGAETVRDQSVQSIKAYGEAKGTMIDQLSKLSRKKFSVREKKKELAASDETLNELIGGAKQEFIQAGQKDLGLG